MTPGSRRFAVLALAAACAVAAGCGSTDTGDPIPGGKVQALDDQLDAVRAAVDDGRCDAVGPAVSKLQTTIATLDSDGVGDDVQDALSDGADNLRSLASSECEPDEEPVETTPETVPEETTVVPPPTETTPPPTETTPPPTETTPPPTTTTPTEPPPDEGDGGAQFDPDTKVPPGQEKKGKIEE